MKSKNFIEKYWGWLFLIVPIILQLIFFYFPLVQGAFYSFTNWTGLTYNYKFVGLNNYKLLFMDQNFAKSIGFTLILTICLIVGEIVIGILVKLKANPFLEHGSSSQLICQV